MEKEEALKILRSGDIDALLNHYSYEEIQQAIDLVVARPSPPSNLEDAANDYCSAYYDWDDEGERKEVVRTFKAGAEWMAGRGVSLTHLIAWYIQSVDASEPVWTEEHLEELVKDYILIPKE